MLASTLHPPKLARFGPRAPITLMLLIAVVFVGCAHKPRPTTTAQPYQQPSKPLRELPIDEPDPPLRVYQDSEVFPRPESLEPAVSFWRKTYAIWSKSQVAIHDDRYLDVIYEIMEFTDPVADSLTQDQKDWVSSRRNYWKVRLAELETKVNAGQELDSHDLRLLATIRKGRAGQSALAGASERVRSQRGTRERFMRGLEISLRYDAAFRKIFREAGLPEDLAYLPHVESSFQASARSSAGAVGVWQFTRAAAERFMTVSRHVDQRLDPVASARGAARYLSYAYSKLGDWPLALTSYNHGINGMIRAKNQMGRDFMHIVNRYDGPSFGFASRNYYAEFLAARDIARNANKFLAESRTDKQSVE